MTTITRERAQEIFLGNGPEPTASEQRELARIALASMGAEPVAWMCEDEEGREYNSSNEFSCSRFGVPLYAAPPTPVVPDYASFEEFWSSFEHPFAEDDELKSFAVEIWNACRAALHQAEPVTTANKLGNSQVHFDCCQEQSPIDHGYRPECECSGCKATARICAELTGNSPVTPDGWISCSERMPEQGAYISAVSKHGEYVAGQVIDDWLDLHDGTSFGLDEVYLWMMLPPLPASPQQ